MRVKKVLQNLDIPLRLLFRTWWNRMTWHWNRERHTFSVLIRSTLERFPERTKKRQVDTYYSGKYLPQSRSGRLGFGLAAIKTVVEFEKRLSHGVRERDPA